MSSDEDEAGTNETAAAPVPTKDEGNKAKNTTPKKKSRKGRVEFDISLPAQHLVSSCAAAVLLISEAGCSQTFFQCHIISFLPLHAAFSSFCSWSFY